MSHEFQPFDSGLLHCKFCGKVTTMSAIADQSAWNTRCTGARLPDHINARCDPRDKWTYQGDILLDAWLKERDE